MFSWVQRGQHTEKWRQNSKKLQKKFILGTCWVKGTGTRDLIWLKVVLLDRSWLAGLTDDLYKILSVALDFLFIF